MLYGATIIINFEKVYKVLILIFLENALRRTYRGLKVRFVSGLNPYFFGKCSTAHKKQEVVFKSEDVLILIFLENALRRDLINPEFNFTECLNPYFFGKCSTATPTMIV